MKPFPFLQLAALRKSSWRSKNLTANEILWRAERVIVTAHVGTYYPGIVTTRMQEKSIFYHESPGEANTEATLLRAKERAESLGIGNIVVASTYGQTGVRACEVFKGFNLVVVRHHTGFQSPGSQQMTEENERAILASGAHILTSGHALSGVERAIRRKRGTVGPLELMADTLRVFGEGTKVCIEITVMAADAGLIPADKPVVAVGGTDRGADTALVVYPAHSNNFFDLYVSEVIAKPSEPTKT